MPKAIHPYDVLVRPLITEKGTYLSGMNKYPFEVLRDSNKLQIKEAVELAFNGLTKDWKKAVVTLEPGQSIELFEGV
jgi:large subunit ribosomal protein L23